MLLPLRLKRRCDFGRLGMIVAPSDGTPAGGVGADHRAELRSPGTASFGRQEWADAGGFIINRIAGLEAAWVCFGGVPRYLVIDNCPPAVAGPDPHASTLHPEARFLEYSCSTAVSSPMRRGLRKPKDKPKVKRGVQYVRERFFKTCGDFHGCLPHPRAQCPGWCLAEVAGMRIHGTTRRKPLVVFQGEEHECPAPW